MVSERNRSLRIVKYLESIGIEVNIGKNKAKGNKGFFKADSCGKFRIDIAKKQTEDLIFSTLIHEFAHFLHYSYDKSLSNLDFIEEGFLEHNMEEFLELTVLSISKKNISPLFEAKEKLKAEINTLSLSIIEKYPDFKKSEPFQNFEKSLKSSPLKYLLKYDRVKVFEGLHFKIYSIKDLGNDFCLEKHIKDYLCLKSKQRALKRINSRISRLNRYYNSPTELFARSMELYLTKRETLQKSAPSILKKYDELLDTEKFPILTNLIKSL